MPMLQLQYSRLLGFSQNFNRTEKVSSTYQYMPKLLLDYWASVRVLTELKKCPVHHFLQYIILSALLENSTEVAKIINWKEDCQKT